MNDERCAGPADEPPDALALPGHLLELAEREKEALARALHDELGSNLTAINLDVASVAAQLPDGVARTRLERSLRVLKEAVELKRRLIQSLRPSMIDSLGLVATLRMEAEAFEARSGIACAATFGEEPSALEPKAAMALYRVAQAALRRIEAGTGVAHVTLDLTQDAERLTLAIETDQDPAALDALSLQTMRARMNHLGGTLETTAAAAGGLRLLACVAAVPRRDEASTPPCSPEVR